MHDEKATVCNCNNHEGEVPEDPTNAGTAGLEERTGMVRGMLCTPQGCCWTVETRVLQRACCEREEAVEAATMMGREDMVKFMA